MYVDGSGVRYVTDEKTRVQWLQRPDYPAGHMTKCPEEVRFVERLPGTAGSRVEMRTSVQVEMEQAGRIKEKLHPERYYGSLILHADSTRRHHRTLLGVEVMADARWTEPMVVLVDRTGLNHRASNMARLRSDPATSSTTATMFPVPRGFSAGKVIDPEHPPAFRFRAVPMAGGRPSAEGRPSAKELPAAEEPMVMNVRLVYEDRFCEFKEDAAPQARPVRSPPPSTPRFHIRRRTGWADGKPAAV